MTRTTNAQFHELHRTVNERRANTQFVKVSVEALRNLLLDHSHFVTIRKEETDDGAPAQEL